MRVVLLAHSPDPEKVVAAAAKQCYSPKFAADIVDTLEPEAAGEFIQRVVSWGHASVIEHVSFTFAIEGVSRAFTHQLVRSRIASYSQQSQRYVSFADFQYIVPPSVAKSEEALGVFSNAMEEVRKAYQKLMELGVDKEDARYVLPNAAETKIVVTMNARSLLHFFELRLCDRAQWEIRQVAWEMLSLVRKVAPSIFAKAGPTCMTQGVCYEGDLACARAKNVRIRKAGGR